MAHNESLIEAATNTLIGDRWYVDEAYVKVAGQWRYAYRSVDQVWADP